jgi:hypothetical protein
MSQPGNVSFNKPKDHLELKFLLEDCLVIVTASFLFWVGLVLKNLIPLEHTDRTERKCLSMLMYTHRHMELFFKRKINNFLK